MSGWQAYLAGVVWALDEAGHHVGGADLVLSSDVPIGAGLSSSAALECATLAVLADLDELVIEPMERAKLARRAENAFVGAPTGQMDQAASTLCEAGNALFFDCRSFDVEQVPLDLAAAGLELLVLDTRTPHALVDSEYAARRETCEAAAAILGVPALRDVTDLDAALDRLDDEVMRKRVRHVVTENQRVLDAADRLHAQDYLGLAPLLDASHASMRDDFEITVPTVDLAVQVADRGRRARRPDDRRRVRRLHHRPGRPGPLRRGGPGHLRGVHRGGLRSAGALRRSPLGRGPPAALSLTVRRSCRGSRRRSAPTYQRPHASPPGVIAFARRPGGATVTAVAPTAPPPTFAFLVHPRADVAPDMARVWPPLGVVPERAWQWGLRHLPLPTMTLAGVHRRGPRERR